MTREELEKIAERLMMIWWPPNEHLDIKGYIASLNDQQLRERVLDLQELNEK